MSLLWQYFCFSKRYISSHPQSIWIQIELHKSKLCEAIIDWLLETPNQTCYNIVGRRINRSRIISICRHFSHLYPAKLMLRPAFEDAIKWWKVQLVALGVFLLVDIDEVAITHISLRYAQVTWRVHSAFGVIFNTSRSSDAYIRQ